MSNTISFRGARGPYGEILPAPLVGGLSPDEALEQLVAANARIGVKVPVPAKGHAREGLVNVALLYAHQMRLREVLSGQFADDYGAALHEAVVMEGEPLSLRPLGLEWLRFPDFAPVFGAQTPGRKVGLGKPMLWRFGLAGRGKTELLTDTDPGEALGKAWAIYLKLCDADEEAFAARAKPLMADRPGSILLDYAVWLLGEEGEWERGAGFRLRVIGTHDTTRLDTPSEARPIRHVGPRRAAMLLDGLARQANAEADWPMLEDLWTWFQMSGVQSPASATWGGGETGLPAQIGANGRSLTLEERSGLLRVLADGKVAAQSLLEPPVREWLATDDGREAVATWAVWAVGREVK